MLRRYIFRQIFYYVILECLIPDPMLWSNLSNNTANSYFSLTILKKMCIYNYYVGGLISFASTVIFLFTLDISG